MITAVTTAISTAIGWIGTVVGSLIDTDGELSALLPLFAIGIAISAISFAIGGIRKITWGA